MRRDLFFHDLLTTRTGQVCAPQTTPAAGRAVTFCRCIFLPTLNVPVTTRLAHPTAVTIPVAFHRRRCRCLAFTAFWTYGFPTFVAIPSGQWVLQQLAICALPAFHTGSSPFAVQCSRDIHALPHIPPHLLVPLPAGRLRFGLQCSD